ncbi:DUF2812 domain-containing protein [Streptococcus sp. X16XC17]|nr:DUF2812 domain-containing protein [Streptococcus sp. X16XC17]
MKKIRFNPLRPQQMEKLLMQQHKNGQALKEISPFTGKMVFVPCQPEDVVYRLDFYQAPNKWVGSWLVCSCLTLFSENQLSSPQVKKSWNCIVIDPVSDSIKNGFYFSRLARVLPF